MEKQKRKRLKETIVVAIVIICLVLIILQLKNNIHNELNAFLDTISTKQFSQK